MKKKLRILLLSTEIAPFNSESPLSEMAFHLSRFYRTQSHDVRVVMPRYSFIRDRKYNLREVIRLKEIPVPLAGKLVMVAVKSGFIPDTKVQLYFLEHEKYFSREGVINDPETGKLYADTDERFIVFSRAIVEMLKILSWQPQIIHATDWTSAMAAYYIRKMYAGDEYYTPSKILLHLTDYKSPGCFPRTSVFKAGIDPDSFVPGCDVELDNQLCFLKGGATYADKFLINGYNTLNEFPPSFGNWFKEHLKSRSADVIQIPFGIDNKTWNADKDEKIPFNYSHKDLAGKKENKKKLIEKYSLKIEPEAPIFGCVWENNGFDFLHSSYECIKAAGGAMVIACKTADDTAISEFAKKDPDRIGTVKLLTGLTLKQLMSGSDFLIMPPEKYPELLHYKAAKYGSIAIAPQCGFYSDDISMEDDKLPGFFYQKGDSVSLKTAVEKATALYKDEKSHLNTVRKAMKHDSTWNKIARTLLDLYTELS